MIVFSHQPRLTYEPCHQKNPCLFSPQVLDTLETSCLRLDWDSLSDDHPYTHRRVDLAF